MVATNVSALDTPFYPVTSVSVPAPYAGALIPPPHPQYSIFSEFHDWSPHRHAQFVLRALSHAHPEENPWFFVGHCRCAQTSLAAAEVSYMALP